MNDEKAFNEVWIVLLLLIAFANDFATAIFSLLAFTGVGLPGEAIMIPINALLGGFFSAVFVLKLGWGGASGLSICGSLVEFLIPSRLLTVGGAIWIANHPKSIASKAVKVAGEIESGGPAKSVGEATEGATAAGELGAKTGKGAAAEGGAETSVTSSGNTTERETPARARAGSTEEGGGETEKSEREKEAEEALMPETEKNPMEVEAERLNKGPDENVSWGKSATDEGEDDERTLKKAA